MGQLTWDRYIQDANIFDWPYWVSKNFWLAGPCAFAQGQQLSPAPSLESVQLALVGLAQYH